MTSTSAVKNVYMKKAKTLTTHVSHMCVTSSRDAAVSLLSLSRKSWRIMKDTLGLKA